jgi:aminoglycoside phosphotransferase family enzyme/predicted kinase
VTVPASQAEIAAFLQAQAGRPPVETHISAVFVGADTVWKLRKAVRLPFLDFTALEERRRTAMREFALNAPHAPGLYRAVTPITRGPGGLALGGEGEPVDWVVVMARVPAERFLDRMAGAGALTPPLLDQLGDTVAAHHASLAPVAHGHAAAMRAVIDGNRLAALGAGLAAGPVEAWHRGARAMLAARAEWFARRSAGGFVRRAHGDLHLGNLCLWQGRPVPFDALEFDEALATIDLGYDLAFLLMDLEMQCGRPAANRVLNRYVARTGDAALVGGLPLFLSLRAMIRAHVRARSGQDPAAYLAAAQAFLTPAPPRALAVGGLPGTGKSTLARAIAPGLGPAPGALVLRSDEARKRAHHVAPEQRLPAQAYTPAAGRAVMAELLAQFGTALGCGHAAIADATFLDPRDRDAVAAAAAPVAFQGVWLDAPLPELTRRVQARAGDASDADAAVLARAAAADPGPIAWPRLDTSDQAAVARYVEDVTRSTSS